jgi:hypothetical protein
MVAPVDHIAWAKQSRQAQTSRAGLSGGVRRENLRLMRMPLATTAAA